MIKTLFDKVWDSHVVKSVKEGPDVLFIDRHMVHEVTSPVAFLGLEKIQKKSIATLSQHGLWMFFRNFLFLPNERSHFDFQSNEICETCILI